MIDEKQLIQEIREDIRDIKQSVQKIELLDAVQNAQLIEHMRRTEANEKRLQLLEDFKWFFGGLTAIITAIVSSVILFFKG